MDDEKPRISPAIHFQIYGGLLKNKVRLNFNKMGNSPGFPESQSPYPGGRRLSDKAAPKNDNFDARWQRFVDSLDVTDEKMKLIEQLPYPRRLELVLNFVRIVRTTFIILRN